MLPKAEVRRFSLLAFDLPDWTIVVQTGRARLFNDLIAGTVGGFVGTALNTPWVSFTLLHSIYQSLKITLLALM